jgi:hypothetical protein
MQWMLFVRMKVRPWRRVTYKNIVLHALGIMLSLMYEMAYSVKFSHQKPIHTKRNGYRFSNGRKFVSVTRSAFYKYVPIPEQMINSMKLTFDDEYQLQILRGLQDH